MNQVGIVIELSDGISLTLVFTDFTYAMVHKTYEERVFGCISSIFEVSIAAYNIYAFCCFG